MNHWSRNSWEQKQLLIFWLRLYSIFIPSKKKFKLCNLHSVGNHYPVITDYSIRIIS